MKAQEIIDQCSESEAVAYAKALYSQKERTGVERLSEKKISPLFLTSSTPASFTAGQIKKEQIKQQNKECREALFAENLI